MHEKFDVLRRLVRAGLILGCALIFSTGLYGQSGQTEDELTILLNQTANSYVSPMMPSLSASLNSSWLSMPPTTRMGFDIRLGGTAALSDLNTDPGSFAHTGQYYLSRDAAEELTTDIEDQPDIREQVITQLVNDGIPINITGTTIVGPANQNMLVRFGDDGEVDFTVRHAEYPFPVHITLEPDDIELELGGVFQEEGLTQFPAAAPQITLGTLYGTQAVIRYIPAIEIDKENGSFSYLGGGLLHNPMVWLPDFAYVDIGLGAFWQQIKLGDIMEMQTVSYGAMVGRSFGPGWANVTPQLGLLWDGMTMDMQYTEELDTPGESRDVTMELALESPTEMRTFVGLEGYLFHLTMFGRYYVSGRGGLTAGVGLSF